MLDLALALPRGKQSEPRREGESDASPVICFLRGLMQFTSHPGSRHPPPFSCCNGVFLVTRNQSSPLWRRLLLSRLLREDAILIRIAARLSRGHHNVSHPRERDGELWGSSVVSESFHLPTPTEFQLIAFFLGIRKWCDKDGQTMWRTLSQWLRVANWSCLGLNRYMDPHEAFKRVDSEIPRYQ